MDAYHATDAQIKSWKDQYGDIYYIIVKDKACYLRRPDRTTLAAMEMAKTNLHASELILNQCWLEGDEEIKTDDNYFVGVSMQLGHLIDYERAEIKKL